MRHQPLPVLAAVAAAVLALPVVALVLWVAEPTPALAALLAAGGAAYVGLSVLAARAIARPLGRLDAWVRRMAGGDATVPEPATAPCLEVARLDEALRAVAARLREVRETLEAELAQERRGRETLQVLQGQTVHRERLAAVGQLISGIAHELNNPLQVIIGMIDLLEHQLPASEALAPDLALIRAESVRAGEIVRNLLQFVRQEPQALAPIDLGEVVTSIARLRRTELETKGIVLDTDIGESRPVHGVFGELQQVLLNLLLNAEHALEPLEGVKRIAIRVSPPADGCICVEVLDSGPGVSAEDEPKLFQPFFTTKPAGQGTGLGLSVSYGIIQAHGGRIGYRPNTWGGATFYFELPIIPERPA